MGIANSADISAADLPGGKPGVSQVSWGSARSAGGWPGQPGWLQSLIKSEPVKGFIISQPADLVDLEKNGVIWPIDGPSRPADPADLVDLGKNLGGRPLGSRSAGRPFGRSVVLISAELAMPKKIILFKTVF